MTALPARRRRLAALAFALLAPFALPVAAQAKAGACPANLKGITTMKVKLTTSMGAITIELDAAKAPVSAENFVKYVQSGHYDGTVFHRVIDGFMIQGGGFTADMKQKGTDAPIENEAANGLKNDKYTIAMARTGEPHSATAQFFINTVDNTFLDYSGASSPGYAVFGEVVAGMDVIDAIAAVQTDGSDRPLEDIVIESCSR